MQRFGNDLTPTTPLLWNVASPTDVLVDLPNLINSEVYYAGRTWYEADHGFGAEHNSELYWATVAALTEDPWFSTYDAHRIVMGLTHFAQIRDLDGGFTLNQIAESLFDQVETRTTYTALMSDDGRMLTDVEGFVASVYINVLGRGCDQEGFDYWVGQLINEASIIPANFILALINGAKPTEQHKADQIYLAIKADNGLYYSAIKGISDVNASRQVMALYDDS